MEDSEQEVSIYVLPSVPNLPPRAVLGQITEEGIVGGIATWNADTGAWMLANGVMVPVELGEAITEHAKSLGVEW